MAGPNRALFDANGDNGDAGYVADPGEVVTFTIRNPNVRSWQLQVWDSNAYATGNRIIDNPPRKSKNAPDVDLVGTTTGRVVSPATPGGSITLTLPTTGTGIHSYLVRSIVDGGFTNGVEDPSKIHTRLIVSAPGGIRKPVVTERGEFELDSWAGPVCDLIDAVFGLSGGTSASAGSRRAVRVATAAALPAYTRSGNALTANANGALPAVDGVSLGVSDRILLVDGQGPSSAAHAGIYDVTSLGGAGSPWVLTRAADMDTSSEAEPGCHFWVLEGTANGGQLAVLAAPSSGITLNTTSLDFELYEFGGAGGGSLPAAAKGDTYVWDGSAVDTIAIGGSGQVYGVPHGQGSGGMPSYYTLDFDDILPGTQKGDTIQWDGDTWIITEIGAEGQVPTVEDGEVVYRDPPVGLPIGGDEGDLTMFKGGGWVRLPVGPSGTVVGSVGGYPTYMLVASGSGGGSGAFFPIGPKGSMLVSDGSAWVPFNIGAAGTFLASDGVTPGWGSPPATPQGPIRLQVRTAVITNVAALSGEQTLSGVALVAGDRVLLTGQTNAAQNGIYVVAAGAWSRATDFDITAEMGRGILVGALEGSGVNDSYWLHTTSATAITVGTTGLTFQRVTYPEALEQGAVLVCTGRNQYAWITGNNGTFLGMVNGEAAFVELPDSTGSGGGNTPEAVANARPSWQALVVDVAVAVTDLPAFTSTSIVITAAADGVMPDVDGISLLNGSTLLVHGFAVECGVYRVSDRGSTTSRWRLTRINYSTMSSEMVVRANRTVSVRYGNEYAEREFLHLTGGSPGAMTVPGSETIDVGTTQILYRLNGADAAEADAALPAVVYADYAARGLSGFAVVIDNTIAATQDGVLIYDDGIPSTPGVGDRILLYGTTWLPASNGVYRVDSIGGTSTSPRWRMTRVPEMSTSEQLLACKIVTILSGNGNGSDHRGTDFFNYTDPDQPFVLNTTVPTFAQEVEEQSQLIWTDVVIDNSVLGASTGSDTNRIITANANGALPTVDGVSPNTYKRVLISGSSPRCGVYDVNDPGGSTSPWRLIRIPYLVTQRQMERCKAVVQRMGASGTGALWVRTAPGEFLVGQVGVASTSWASAASVGGSRVVHARTGTTAGGLPAYNQVGNNLTAVVNGVLPNVGGVAPAVGMKVLIHGTLVGAGVYTITSIGGSSTPWTMTRAPELDTSAKVDDNAAVAVGAGTSAYKLFIRGLSGPVTLNTTTLAWVQATSENELAPSDLHATPPLYSTTSGWLPWQTVGNSAVGPNFAGISLPNIRSTTEQRGIYVEQVHATLPARIMMGRSQGNGTDSSGDVAEIVSQSFIGSSSIGAAYENSHKIRSVVQSNTFPWLSGGPPVITGHAFDVAGWTAATRQGIVRGQAAAIYNGMVAVQRIEPAATVGMEWGFGFKHDSLVFSRITAKARKVSGGSVQAVTHGVQSIFGSSLLKLSESTYDELTSSSSSLTPFEFAIPLVAQQLCVCDYEITGIRSDGNGFAVYAGRIIAYRAASGNITLMNHAPLPYFRTDASWGDSSEVGAAVSVGSQSIIFNVKGDGDTINWALDAGWKIRNRAGAAYVGDE